MRSALTILTITASLLGLFLPTKAVRAAIPPQFLVTWQSGGYVPSSYTGKTLPVPGATVRVSLELIDGGKLANLSQQEIRWYRGINLFYKGIGAVTSSFAVEPTDIGGMNLRIVVVGFKGVDSEKTIFIPVVSPELVVDAPYVDHRIPPHAGFTALPYFFSVSTISSLSFNWTANGIGTSGEAGTPSALQLDTSRGSSGTQILLTAHVANKLNPLESAGSIVPLTLR